MGSAPGARIPAPLGPAAGWAALGSALGQPHARRTARPARARGAHPSPLRSAVGDGPAPLRSSTVCESMLSGLLGPPGCFRNAGILRFPWVPWGSTFYFCRFHSVNDGCAYAKGPAIRLASRVLGVSPGREFLRPWDFCFPALPAMHNRHLLKRIDRFSGSESDSGVPEVQRGSHFSPPRPRHALLCAKAWGRNRASAP